MYVHIASLSSVGNWSERMSRSNSYAIFRTHHHRLRRYSYRTPPLSPFATTSTLSPSLSFPLYYPQPTPPSCYHSPLRKTHRAHYVHNGRIGFRECASTLCTMYPRHRERTCIRTPVRTYYDRQSAYICVCTRQCSAPRSPAEDALVTIIIYRCRGLCGALHGTLVV